MTKTRLHTASSRQAETGNHPCSARAHAAACPRTHECISSAASNPAACREPATVTGRRPPVGYHCPRKAGMTPGEGGTPASTQRDKPTLLGNPDAGLHHQPRMVKTSVRTTRVAWPFRATIPNSCTCHSRDTNGRCPGTRHWLNFRSPRGAQSCKVVQYLRQEAPPPSRAATPKASPAAQRALSPGHVLWTSGAARIFASARPVDGHGVCAVWVNGAERRWRQTDAPGAGLKRGTSS